MTEPPHRSRTDRQRDALVQRSHLPLALAAPAVLAAALLLVPLAAVVLRAPWVGLPRLLAAPEVRDALALSLTTATIATVVSLILGVPLAWYFAVRESRVVGLLRGLVTVPLVLPPVVGGIALLMAFGRTGVIGRWLDEWFGLTLPFSPAAVILAQTFVAMPFLIVTVEGAFRSTDGRYAEAARTLGASPTTVFWRVSMPMILPAVAAGTALTWARALGEFGATITFAGNFPGQTQTMPLAAYLALQTDPDAALALSLVLLVVSVLILWTLRGQWAGRWLR